MFASKVILDRSSDVGSMKNHGSAVRDVLIERNEEGDLCVKYQSEFTNQEVLLGLLMPMPVTKIIINDWLDSNFKEYFLAIYIEKIDLVVVDYYQSIF